VDNSSTCEAATVSSILLLRLLRPSVSTEHRIWQNTLAQPVTFWLGFGSCSI